MTARDSRKSPKRTVQLRIIIFLNDMKVQYYLEPTMKQGSLVMRKGRVFIQRVRFFINIKKPVQNISYLVCSTYIITHRIHILNMEIGLLRPLTVL